MKSPYDVIIKPVISEKVSFGILSLCNAVGVQDQLVSGIKLCVVFNIFDKPFSSKDKIRFFSQEIYFSVLADGHGIIVTRV